MVQLTPQGVPQVVHANLPCAVGCNDVAWNVGFAGGGGVQNLMTPSGGHKLILHGQIPADQMSALLPGVTAAHDRPLARGSDAGPTRRSP